jgi:diacylglycerol kinase
MTGSPPRATIREVTPPRPAPSKPAQRAPSRTAAPIGRPSGSVLQQEHASFGYAFEGLRYAWRTQRHLRIHASLAILAIGLGLALTITASEWAALLTVITLVLALELLNTVIEAVVDLVTSEFRPNAKIAKDVAAGAVLLAAAGATAVGAAIFLPRLWSLATTVL